MGDRPPPRAGAAKPLIGLGRKPGNGYNRGVRQRLAIPILVALLIVGALWARSYFSPGSAAKRELRSMVRAVEDERLLAVMSSVSRAYADHLGLTYESFAGYVGETIDTYEDVDVDLIITDVAAAETEVTIGVRFIVWGSVDGSRGYIVGSMTDPCTATVLWRKETPGWRLASTLQLDIPELRDELEELEQR